MAIHKITPRKQKRKIPTIFVTLVAVILTTLITTFFVTATDTTREFRDSLGSVVVSGVFEKENPRCPKDMRYIHTSDGGFCIDTFESSPSKECAYALPQNSDETLVNSQNEKCTAESKVGALPWTNVKQHEAERLCRSAGKRLPSNKEWYLASLGTPDTRKSLERATCNINSKNEISLTGSFDGCHSDSFVYDLIGNVWEWTNEMVVNGEYNGRDIPEEGYVAGVDDRGVAILTNKVVTDKSFFDDYVWTDADGVFGMIRGGYFQSGADAGSYSINMSISPTFSGSAVGFRCVL